MNDEEKKAAEKLTGQQRKALELYFTKLARAFNEEGIGMKIILSKATFDAPATKYAMKEYLWRAVQIQMLGKQSTKDLTKIGEIEMVYDALNKFVSDNWHFSVAFPSMEELLHELRVKEELREIKNKLKKKI